MKSEDWKKQYKAPAAGSMSWTLPAAIDIAYHLLICGGLPLRLVDELTQTDSYRDALLFQIEELMSRPENADASKEWERLCLIGQKAAYRLGTDKLLMDYSYGRIKHATLLQKIGVRLWPEPLITEFKAKNRSAEILASLEQCDEA